MVLADAIRFICVIGVLVIVHEFGHFIAARFSGIRVEKFSIGFGPALIKRVIGNTEFLVCIVPLGGYVKLAGDQRGEETGKSDEFLEKSPGIRARVVFAGPLFNYIFAFLLIWFVFMSGIPDIDAVIGGVVSDSVAAQAGLKPGDRVVKINNSRISTWFDLERGVENAGGEIAMVIMRNGQEKKLFFSPRELAQLPEADEELMSLGITYYFNQVGSVLAQSPAQAAGIKEGDIIAAINGTYVNTWFETKDLIGKSRDKVEVTIVRDGQEKTIEIRPKIVKRQDEAGRTYETAVIGIVPFMQMCTVRYNPFTAFYKSGEKIFTLTATLLTGFYAIFSGMIPVREAITGPIGIYRMTSSIAHEGFWALLLFVSIISMSLAVVNLFPIPVLDGGYLVLLGIEKLRKKALSEKAEMMLVRIGIVVISLVAIFVFYNDISKIVEKNKRSNELPQSVTYEQGAGTSSNK